MTLLLVAGVASFAGHVVGIAVGQEYLKPALADFGALAHRAVQLSPSLRVEGRLRSESEIRQAHAMRNLLIDDARELGGVRGVDRVKAFLASQAALLLLLVAVFVSRIVGGLQVVWIGGLFSAIALSFLYSVSVFSPASLLALCVLIGLSVFAAMVPQRRIAVFRDALRGRFEAWRSSASADSVRSFDDRAGALGKTAAQAGKQLESRAQLAAQVAASVLVRAKLVGWIGIAVGLGSVVGGSVGIGLFVKSFADQIYPLGSSPSSWLALGITSMVAIGVGLCVGLLRYSSRLQEQYASTTQQADRYRDFLLALDLSDPTWTIDNPDAIRGRIIARLFEGGDEPPSQPAQVDPDDALDLKLVSDVLKNTASALASVSKVGK